MSWYQRASCGDAQGGDGASDGDLDIAYALLLADKQRGSCGTYDYAAEAQQVVAAIRSGEVDATGRYLRLADRTTPAEPAYYNATRSSDLMADHVRTFVAATGDGVWTDVRDHTYRVVDALQATHSPTTGLLPHFIPDPLGTPHRVAPYFLELPSTAAACLGSILP